MAQADSYAMRPTLGSSTAVSVASTASPLGVHDALRHGGPRSLAAEADAVHPLQASLSRYDDTQAELKLTLQRNLLGLHAPIRHAMERELVAGTPSFIGVGRPSNIHLDILMGRDETLDVNDVLGVEASRARAAYDLDFHSEMERARRL